MDSGGTVGFRPYYGDARHLVRDRYGKCENRTSGPILGVTTFVWRRMTTNFCCYGVTRTNQGPFRIPSVVLHPNWFWGCRTNEWHRQSQTISGANKFWRIFVGKKKEYLFRRHSPHWCSYVTNFDPLKPLTFPFSTYLYYTVFRNWQDPFNTTDQPSGYSTSTVFHFQDKEVPSGNYTLCTSYPSSPEGVSFDPDGLSLLNGP